MARSTPRNLSFNSSTRVFRRSKQPTVIPAKRDLIPIKLPSIVNRKPSRVVKPSSSVQYPDSPQSTLTTSLVINGYSPHDYIQPIAGTSYLASIKDHVTKENLAQRAALKCKSPRVGSAFSRSTVFGGGEGQEQTKSSRPLQGMDVGSLLDEVTRGRLTHLFNKLDTDRDGHLSYTQLQRCLPPNLPHAQMTFFRVLYDVISGTTYFGLQEFYAIAIIVEMVSQQDVMLWKTFLDDVDFNYYHDDIAELLEEFNNQCSSKAAIIPHENLVQLILKRTTNGRIERIAKELQYVIPNVKTIKINRLDFIALLPAIIYIESRLDNGQTLFRFRENSLLDQQMQRALLS